MSKQNLQAFYKVFRTDLSLQKQLDGIADEYMYAEKAVEIGRDRGFEFTAADVKAALAEPEAFLEGSIAAELGDYELEAIAGGTLTKCSSDNLGSGAG
ncbi:MAG: Nif11-like leader peptide family natural product precursor [Geitlerinemataceae cyanobacterium]